MREWQHYIHAIWTLCEWSASSYGRVISDFHRIRSWVCLSQSARSGQGKSLCLWQESKSDSPVIQLVAVLWRWATPRSQSRCSLCVIQWNEPQWTALQCQYDASRSPSSHPPPPTRGQLVSWHMKDWTMKWKEISSLVDVFCWGRGQGRSDRYIFWERQQNLW